MTNGVLALLGLALILLAIPLGLMIAPLVLGIALVWVVLRRADRAMTVGAGSAAR